MTAPAVVDEGALERAVLEMYTDVAVAPDKEYHFWTGRAAAELFGYQLDWIEAAPRQAVDSFAGVGNPHRHVDIPAGATVVDLGSGAGLDSFIAAHRAGASRTPGTAPLQNPRRRKPLSGPGPIAAAPRPTHRIARPLSCRNTIAPRAGTSSST